MANFERAIESVIGAVDYIHCDVMDAHFVPNLTFGAPVIKAIKRVSQGVPLDVHLMIEKPIRWIPRFLETGLGPGDFLTFHSEAESEPVIGLDLIRTSGVGAGLSVKPKSSIRSWKGLIGKLDQVLIMTVEPGFGGQAFMRDMLPKITEARAMFGDKCTIAVDGGIDAATAPDAYRAGADLLIAGNAVYGKPNPAEAARMIRNACQESR